MKTLTQISGAVIEDAAIDSPKNVRAAHVVEPAPGFMLRITVGTHGVIVSRPPHGFCIPAAEILRLAGEHVAELRPPKGAQASGPAAGGAPASGPAEVHPPA
jgi:hypothetical protein